MTTTATISFIVVSCFSIAFSKQLNGTQMEKLLVYQYHPETNTSTLIANESTPDKYGLVYDIASNSYNPIVKEIPDSNTDDFPESMPINCKSDFKRLSCGTFSLVGCTRNKRFYAESSIKMDWFDSWELCRSHGMILASIESRYEQHILETYLIEKDIREDSSLKPYWTSGTSFGRGSSYIWLATGKDFSSSFNYFLKDERVTNGISENDKSNYCVQLMISSDASTSDYWHINDCKTVGFTLCQMASI